MNKEKSYMGFTPSSGVKVMDELPTRVSMRSSVRSLMKDNKGRLTVSRSRATASDGLVFMLLLLVLMAFVGFSMLAAEWPEAAKVLENGFQQAGRTAGNGAKGFLEGINGDKQQEQQGIDQNSQRVKIN
jgi:hypothetical protein